MSATTGRVSRRQFSKLFGFSVFAAPWVMEQRATTPSGKAEPVEAKWTESQKREAQKAVEALQKTVQTLAKFDLSVAVEPAFVFRARTLAARRPRVRAAEERRGALGHAE